jgi:hypothetical protein
MVFTGPPSAPGGKMVVHGGKRMRGWRFIALCLAVLCLTATDAFTTEWFRYYADPPESGVMRCYIDKRGMARTSEGTILVLEKIETIREGEAQIHLEQVREVDCSNRRYRILDVYAYRPGGGPISTSKRWLHFGATDYHSALFDTVCGKGKKK